MYCGAQLCLTLPSHGLKPTRLLCPWDFPGKNTGVGCHFLLQVIFPTQGQNPHLLSFLHWQVDSLPPHHLGRPRLSCMTNKSLGGNLTPLTIVHPGSCSQVLQGKQSAASVALKSTWNTALFLSTSTLAYNPFFFFFLK